MRDGVKPICSPIYRQKVLNNIISVPIQYTHSYTTLLNTIDLNYSDFYRPIMKNLSQVLDKNKRRNSPAPED